MKITGLITEYNPFHNGHLYHIRKSKEVTGSDYCIALMSGTMSREAPRPFTISMCGLPQLSQPEPISSSRCRCPFPPHPRWNFASYSIALFSALGIDSVCFGSECGDIAALTKIAGLLSDEPVQFKEALRTYLKNGMTFPEARHGPFCPFWMKRNRKS